MVDDDDGPTRAQLIDALIAVIILLWPLEIGPEIFGGLPGPGGPPASGPPPVASVRPAPLRELPVADANPGLMAAFRASFRRQAARSLHPCLEAWRPSPASVHAQGQLHPDGSLRRVRLVGNLEQLPACARRALNTMRFEALRRGIAKPYVRVRWRLEW